VSDNTVERPLASTTESEPFARSTTIEPDDPIGRSVAIELVGSTLAAAAEEVTSGSVVALGPGVGGAVTLGADWPHATLITATAATSAATRRRSKGTIGKRYAGRDAPDA
jgi:hypothetical protein